MPPDLAALNNLIRKVGCGDADPSLFSTAFVHESTLSDRDDARTMKVLLNGLGAIGKRAIEASIITHYFVIEGVVDTTSLTSIIGAVRKYLITDVVDQYKLFSFGDLGRSFDRDLANTSLGETLVARLSAAVVLSSSFETFSKIMGRSIKVAIDRSRSRIYDAKSCLLEIGQKLYGQTPVYKVISIHGPDHAKEFCSEVFLPQGASERGSGRSIQEAEQEAARIIIQKRKLITKAPEIVRKYTVGTQEKVRGMNSRALRVSPQALRAALKFSSVLNCEFLDPVQLGVALTMSKRSERDNYDTNNRHKMLGSALDSLAIQLYIYRHVLQEMIAAAIANPQQLEAYVRSSPNYARLYRVLELSHYVQSNDIQSLSEERQADVLQSISAALFLSGGSFDRFYNWVVPKLGPWISAILNDSVSRPWSLLDPKNLLQEVMQATGSFEVTYSSQGSGPSHNPEFQATVACVHKTARDRKYALGSGRGRTKGEAEKAAASVANTRLLPSTHTSKSELTIASVIWRTAFDNAINRAGVLPPLGFPAHLRTFRCVHAYWELRGFINAFPDLQSYLSDEKFRAAILRSVRVVSPFPIRQIQELTLKGVRLWAGIPPDDFNKFLETEMNTWLAEYRRITNTLKLPAAPAEWPSKQVPVTDLSTIVRLEKVRCRITKDTPISTNMMSHLITLLETFDDQANNPIEIEFDYSFEDECEVLVATTPKEFLDSSYRRALTSFVPQAFFLGTEDSVQEDSNRVRTIIRTLCPASGSACIGALRSILEGMLAEYEGIHSLFRVVHDLKNQFIAIQNNARQLSQGSSGRYQLLARIDEVQQSIREREYSIRALFEAVGVDEPRNCDLNQTINEFVSRELYNLPENIRLQLDRSVDGGLVKIDPAQVVSILTNLTRNAVEAMPQGGDLSVSLLFKKSDGELLVEIRDTGCGIREELLPSLLTELRSTKKGMGLGLATVNQIVHQYGGKIDVESKLGVGTKIWIMVPLQVLDDQR